MSETYIAQNDEERRHRGVAIHKTIEIFKTFPAQLASNVLYVIACNHAGLSADELEELSNRIGQEAHERKRHGN